MARVVRNDWGERGGRRSGQLGVKYRGTSPEMLLKLPCLSDGEESGIPGVAVECVDIRRNTRGEGGFLDIN